jgi:hypothetical protein
VAQFAAVGAMLASLYAFLPAVQNAFVVGGLVAGGVVGWIAGRALRKTDLFFRSLVVGGACGVAMLASLALRTRDPVLILSGASLGLFLTMPMFVLALPAFATRGRAVRSRHGSVLREADALATWAGSCASITLLGLAHQPRLEVHGRTLDLSLPVLAASAVVSLAVVVADVRTSSQLRRLDGGSPAAPRDVGIGADVVEQRIPPSDPFRSAEKVTLVTVGSVAEGGRALAASLRLDALTCLFCVASVAFRVVELLQGTR